MSAGSPIVPIRIPPLFLAAIDRAIESANKTTKEQPYTRTSWILLCVATKLDHLARSKKSKAKKRQQAKTRTS